LEEDKFHRYDDDSDACNKACDFFRKAQLDQLQYQKKVREEYEAYGYVRVEYDEDESRRNILGQILAYPQPLIPDRRIK
jgi:hypothetical protein